MKRENKAQKESLRRRLATRYGNVANAQGETVILRGRRGVTVYGCRRILSYAPCEIKLSLGRVSVTVMGKELYCSSFSSGTVSVEGKVHGVIYGGAGED